MRKRGERKRKELTSSEAGDYSINGVELGIGLGPAAACQCNIDTEEKLSYYITENEMFSHSTFCNEAYLPCLLSLAGVPSLCCTSGDRVGKEKLGR